jgi:drug/metabolite transporter (DMT)-like permease
LGYAFAGLNAIISGCAIYVNGLGVKLFSDSTVYTTLKNAVVGVALLLPLFFLAKQRAELRRLTIGQWGKLLLLAMVGGSLPYALFFRGLQLTTPVTSSLLNHTQFLLVAVLAVFLLAERVGPVIWLALAALLVGTSLGSNLHMLRWNQGAILILISTVLFAAGVVLAKYLLREISTMNVMMAKMSIGSLMLVGYVAATGRIGKVMHLSAVQWEYVLVTGAILLAFTVTAFLALRYISATVATAIPAAAPIITTLLVALTTQRIHLAPLDGGGLVLMALALLALYIAGPRAERRGVTATQEKAALA